MKPRSVPILETAALEAMPTRQLVSRLRALLRCEDEPDFSDWSPEELAGVDGIIFKQSDEWRRAYAELKSVLATREHVPRPLERQAARRERARAGRDSGRRDRR